MPPDLPYLSPRNTGTNTILQSRRKPYDPEEHQMILPGDAEDCYRKCNSSARREIEQTLMECRTAYVGGSGSLRKSNKSGLCSLELVPRIAQSKDLPTLYRSTLPVMELVILSQLEMSTLSLVSIHHVGLHILSRST